MKSKNAHHGNKVIFLDRDGTIICDKDYIRDPEKVEPLHGVGEVLAYLKECGFLLVMVSNQSGIGRGILTSDEVEGVNKRLFSILSECNVSLDAVYYCPHSPEEQCSCRKPSPKMLLLAARDLNLDLTRSFMIGDKFSDIEAGKRAGCKTILLRNDFVEEETDLKPDFIASNWVEVLSYVLNK